MDFSLNHDDDNKSCVANVWRNVFAVSVGQEECFACCEKFSEASMSVYALEPTLLRRYSSSSNPWFLHWRACMLTFPAEQAVEVARLELVSMTSRLQRMGYAHCCSPACQVSKTGLVTRIAFGFIFQARWDGYPSSSGRLNGKSMLLSSPVISVSDRMK